MGTRLFRCLAPSHLLVIDVGNTALTYGWAHKIGRLTGVKTILHSDIPKIANKLSPSGKFSHFDTVISSVVPKITPILKKHLGGISRAPVWVAGQNLPVKIRHNYFNLNKLGIDRRVNAWGAAKLYGAPVLIFDYGTALTVDFVSRNQTFAGGLIIPGPQIAFQALAQKTALLPKNLRLPEKAPRLLGRNTAACMKAGILEGYGAMAQDLIRRFKARYGKNIHVLATGGFAKTIARHAHGFDRIDPHHTLKSLALLHICHSERP